MARREYKGAATPCTLVTTITSSSTTIVISDATNWPTGSFSLVIDPGLAGEEKILIASRTAATLTVTTRGYDNTTAAAHVTGAVMYPVPTAIDFDEANNLVSGITAGTGIAMAGSTSGSTLFKSSAVAGTTTVTLPAATDTLVGLATTDTLTNKSLSDSTTAFIDVADATKKLKIDVTGTTGITGTLTSAFTTAKTLTFPDATDTLVGKATTDTLTNKTLTSPVITTPKISSTYTAKTAAYTFASGDEGNIFSMNNAATQQFNIPTDATFAFAVGTEINVFWITGAGQPTIGAVTPGTTTVISTGATSATPKLRVANSGATCKKLATDSWIVFGDLS